MDLIEALDAAGIEYHQGSSSDEINICCPFCIEQGEMTEDTRFRLGINIRTGYAHCYNCEWGSRTKEYTFAVLQKALETGELEASEKVVKKKSHATTQLPEGYERIQHPSEYDDHWNKVAYRYLRKRGITYEQIQSKKIGFSVVGEMHHRVIFPVYVHGKLQGIVGRDFTEEQELKYRNSVGDKAIYNLPDRHHKSIVLLEGVFDTLVVERPARKMGIDAGGLLGHVLKDDQLELIDRYKNIYLWLDPDKAGIKGYLSITKKLPKDKLVRAVLPRGVVHEGAEDNDPSELDASVIARRLAHAPVFTEHLQLKLKAWGAFDDE